jgi:membrane protein DedA with SNARE-associated domain
VLLMAVESACIPIPSEIIMPLAGWFLVQAKGHGFEWVLVAGALGALGNTIGSVVAYYVGAAGGRPLLERYGRFLLITTHDLDRADAFFARRGPLAVCISRVLPVVRTFISLPAGIARMRFGLFVVLTFVGSFVWSLALAWGGYALGQHWQRVSNAIRPFDYPILALIVLGIAWFIWRHVRRDRTPHPPMPASATSHPNEGGRRAP